MSRDRRRPPTGEPEILPPSDRGRRGSSSSSTAPTSADKGTSGVPAPLEGSRVPRRRQSTIGRIMSAVADRKATDHERRAQDAHTGFVRAQAETGEQLERLYRVKNRIENIDQIIATDIVEIAADFEAADRELAELKHQAALARDVHEAERLEAQIRILEAKQKLEAMKNPPKKSDPSQRIREIQVEMQAINDELADPTLPVARKAELRERRRGLDSELEILKARGGS